MDRKEPMMELFNHASLFDAAMGYFRATFCSRLFLFSTSQEICLYHGWARLFKEAKRKLTAKMTMQHLFKLVWYINPFLQFPSSFLVINVPLFGIVLVWFKMFYALTTASKIVWFSLLKPVFHLKLR